jgi:hypothetical protein
MFDFHLFTKFNIECSISLNFTGFIITPTFLVAKYWGQVNLPITIRVLMKSNKQL